MSLLFRVVGVCLLMLNVSCQFNMKVTDDDSNRLKVNRVNYTNFYMHNATGIESENFDIFLDSKKVNLKKLDSTGLKVKPGRHVIDVIKRDSKDPKDHFEINVTKEQSEHLYLCNEVEKVNHFRLVTEKDKHCAEQRSKSNDLKN